VDGAKELEERQDEYFAKEYQKLAADIVKEQLSQDSEATTAAPVSIFLAELLEKGLTSSQQTMAYDPSPPALPADVVDEWANWNPNFLDSFPDEVDLVADRARQRRVEDDIMQRRAYRASMNS